MKGVDLSYCYADVKADRESVGILADNCYLPVNQQIRTLIHEYKGSFKVAFSISGTALELFQKHRPDVIRSFQQMVETGCVEILGETYYHSLSFLHSKREFQRQVTSHTALVEKIFRLTPTVFRNTELIYNNQLAEQLAGLGFKGVVCEGIERILQGRSPNCLYAAPGQQDIALFLRNVGLSDDIAFRFDDKSWNEYPLTAGKFAQWLHTHPAETSVVNLMVDYETFGIFKKPGSGIFEFLSALPGAVLANNNFTFSVPSVVLNEYAIKDVYDSPTTISWEDRVNASCVWSENMRQNNTLKKIYSIRDIVMNSGNEKAIDTWGRLQAADYFYYMSEESCEAATYKYHNPFITSEEAFQNYSNIVADFEIALIEHEIAARKRNLRKTSIINSIL